MHLATALYGLACLVTCIIVAKDDARLLVALALGEAWAVATIGWHLGMLAIVPVLDLGVVLAVLLVGGGRRWAAVVIAVTGLRLVAHVACAFGASYAAYAVTLNLTFAIMLAALVAEEAIDAARRFGDRLSVCFRRDHGRAFRPVAPAKMAAE